MIARLPGVVPAGKTTGHLSCFQDVLPTICELIDQPVPRQNTGISFLPTLKGVPGKQQAHEFLYWEFCKGSSQKIFSQAVRMGKWKAYRQVGRAMELFNLEDDPYEKKNIARERPELIAKMEAAIQKAHQPLPTQ